MTVICIREYRISIRKTHGFQKLLNKKKSLSEKSGGPLGGVGISISIVVHVKDSEATKVNEMLVISSFKNILDYERF